MHCVVSRHPPEDEQIPKTIEVELDYPDDSDCPFSMGDRCFSLSQYIGWPRVPDDTSTDDCKDVNSPAACVGKSLCDPGTIARGMEYRRNEAGFITGLNLDCFQGPS